MAKYRTIKKSAKTGRFSRSTVAAAVKQVKAERAKAPKAAASSKK